MKPEYIEIPAVIPAGMVEVPKERFYDLLHADPRDIMPSDRSDYWEVVATRERWGWDGGRTIFGGPVAWAVRADVLAKGAA